MQGNEKKVIVFLSSKAYNLAYDVAQSCPEYEVFLIMDKQIPLDFEQEMLGNFYINIFDKQKIFQKNKEKYFDLLAMYLLDFEPDSIVCSNYHKLLSQSFIDFINFRNSHIQILNVHHGDLRLTDSDGDMLYDGIDGWKREFIGEEKFVSTIHLIEDKGMDTGKQLNYSEETTFEELEEIELIKDIDDLENLRVCSVILHYHEQSKVLELLVNEIRKIL